jgi:hypothetical protein
MLQIDFWVSAAGGGSLLVVAIRRRIDKNISKIFFFYMTDCE